MVAVTRDEAIDCSLLQLGINDHAAVAAFDLLIYTSQIVTVSASRDQLAKRGGAWQVLETTRNQRAVVNQTVVDFDTRIKEDDEVAFSPPVTGGEVINISRYRQKTLYQARD